MLPYPSARPDNRAGSQSESIQLRLHHARPSNPTLVYLPGLHGDWTLLAPFRSALGAQCQLVEFTYPRRTDWKLEDYASAVASALAAQGIHRAWLLGESFSSQIAWKLLADQRARNDRRTPQFEGLILAGGFVRHPWPWGVALAHRASGAVPMWLLKAACRTYGKVAGRKACDCPALAADLDEFVQRRTTETDRAAITSRYTIISENDLRPIAESCQLPVFQLSGGIDPIVPWWEVRPWLRRHCPGYRGSRIIAAAGHNVLMSAPHESARQILDWIGSEGETAPVE